MPPDTNLRKRKINLEDEEILKRRENKKETL